MHLVLWSNSTILVSIHLPKVLDPTTIPRLDLILFTPYIHAFISVNIVRLITATQFFLFHSLLCLPGSARIPGTSPQLLVNSFNQGSWHSALPLAGAVILFRVRRRGNRMSATWEFHPCQYTHRSAQHSRVPSLPLWTQYRCISIAIF